MRLVEKKKTQSGELVGFFRKTSFVPTEINPILDAVGSKEVTQGDKLVKVFSRPKVKMEHMLKLKSVADFVNEHELEEEVLEQAEIQVKYAGYIEKEKANADKLQRLENIRIPDDFDFMKLSSLSMEAREKLSSIRPATISQASRISGVSPSDISVLLVFLGR
jgi:tRNA uridine 5-carboxymethylaminomethyl modification enzyme